MADSRTKNTKRNIVFSYLDTFVTLIFQFASRTVIVKVLGEQYLGLSSLFTSILGVLNMAELGFSGAIIFNMYKPIADNDADAVCALLKYYRTIYRHIAVIVLVAGIAVSPFLPRLIKGSVPADINLYILYFLYLFNTALSYALFAYKTALLNALQRLDLVKIAYTIANIIQYSMQIVCILIFENYYLFVLWMIFGTVAKNLIAAYISNTRFPQFLCAGEVSTTTKKDILSRVKGLLICNISSVTYTTLDSIILSAFLGLTSVAIYNNYIVIWNGVISCVVLIRNAMQASVGNSVALESKEKNYNDMLLWQFLFAGIAGFCMTCMLSLYQPFMVLWMREDLLLPLLDVVLLCIWFFVVVIQHSVTLYLSGNGLWWEMRWPYICSTVCNLILNICLGKLYGTTGIILASVIASVLFGLIWQCSIIYRLYFKRSAKDFWLRQLLFFGIGCFTAGVAFLINNGIAAEGIIGIAIRLIICIVISIVVFWLSYNRLEEFSRAKALFYNAIKQ